MPSRVNQKILAMLSPENLVTAYASGIFPMVERGRCMWFDPDPRGLMPVDERFHVSRRLARTVKSGRFICTVDRSFQGVMRGCARRPEGTWISAEIMLAYTRLHELHLAHSVEAWLTGPDGEPVNDEGQSPASEVCPCGGLYGVTLGGAFFAESMFHRTTDAGKVALAFLIERLRNRGYLLCDVQWTTDNLRRFGAFDLPGEDYHRLLEVALDKECRFD
jgi:leucyl/phenylalanyl-tRNA---protein transferase